MRVALLTTLLAVAGTARATQVIATDGGQVTLSATADPDELIFEGATVLSMQHSEATARARDTEILLHGDPGDALSVREIARGWAAGVPLSERAELIGEAGPVQGSDALSAALADHFADPLPDLSPNAFLSASGRPGLRRILIATLPVELPDDPPLDGTLTHVVILRGPGETHPLPGDGLRAAIARGGGEFMVVDTVEDGRARLQGLRLREPKQLTATVELCAMDPQVFVRGPGESRTAITAALPPCNAPDQAEVRAPGVSLWIPATAGTISVGLLGLIGGLLWRRGQRARQEGLADEATDQEVPPGTLVAPVDPDATAWLTIQRGSGLVDSVIPLAVGALSVGAASGNDAVIDLEGISGRHARFERFPTGDVFVADADSANGTWVGGRRLSRGERARLRPGDRVALGPSLELELGQPSEAE